MRSRVMRSTHTYVELEVSPAAWREIREKLEAAGYQHTFVDERTTDMHGIAVVPEKE